MLTLNRTPLNQMEDTCNQTQARLFEFLFWLGSLSRLAIMTVHLFFEIMQFRLIMKWHLGGSVWGHPAVVPGWAAEQGTAAHPSLCGFPGLLHSTEPGTVTERDTATSEPGGWCLVPEEAGQRK